MMKHKGYVGKVEYDAEAKKLHGEVVGLRDVITFEASTVAGIEKAFRESVDDYLEFCRSRGEKAERPYSGQFVVRVGGELHRQLSELAEGSGKSLNTVVVEALRERVSEGIKRRKKIA
jgi:predicted HicB family RNase H-like nuclease